MSISYTQKDIMVYELHWEIFRDQVYLYSWATNTNQEQWEVHFLGKHRKLLKIFNNHNHKMAIGKI